LKLIPVRHREGTADGNYQPLTGPDESRTIDRNESASIPTQPHPWIAIGGLRRIEIHASRAIRLVLRELNTSGQSFDLESHGAHFAAMAV
jgi:hypothetical protein